MAALPFLIVHTLLVHLIQTGLEMSKSYPSQAGQYDRFIEAARRIGADEDEAAFKAKLAQIVRQKPKEEVPEPPKDEQ